jgi:hypothetical protein
MIFFFFAQNLSLDLALVSSEVNLVKYCSVLRATEQLRKLGYSLFALIIHTVYFTKELIWSLLLSQIPTCKSSMKVTSDHHYPDKLLLQKGDIALNYLYMFVCLIVYYSRHVLACTSICTQVCIPVCMQVEVRGQSHSTLVFETWCASSEWKALANFHKLVWVELSNCNRGSGIPIPSHSI